MKITGSTLALAMALLTGLPLPRVAIAAAPLAFPVKPVRWVVPYPPGESIDVVAHVIAARLSHAWGISCFVENRPGAGGRVGVQSVISSPPGGYTQLMALNTHYTTDRSVFKDLGYDADMALSPVTIVASTSQLLTSNLSFPPKNVKELVALARARPGEINDASSGAGGSLHLALELFKSITGIRMNHIVYNGGLHAATDLIAGHIQVIFLNTPIGVPYVKGGKVRALGVSTANAHRTCSRYPP